MRIDSMEISASGLRAQRTRMDAVANNLANMDNTDSGAAVTETDRNGNPYVRHTPYRRQVPIFTSGVEAMDDPRLGVSVPIVLDDFESALRKEFQPEHPHAVKNPDAADFGYVYFPNVNPLMETVDMIAAQRGFEANIQAIDAFKSMGESSLRILA